MRVQGKKRQETLTIRGEKVTVTSRKRQGSAFNGFDMVVKCDGLDDFHYFNTGDEKDFIPKSWEDVDTRMRAVAVDRAIKKWIDWSREERTA